MMASGGIYWMVKEPWRHLNTYDLVIDGGGAKPDLETDTAMKGLACRLVIRYGLLLPVKAIA